MAGLPAWNTETSVTTLLDDYLMIHGRLHWHGLTKTLATEFATIRAEIDVALAEEWKLVAARYEAAAAVLFLDGDLNEIVDGVAQALTANFGADSKEYHSFFQGRAPSDLKSPLARGRLSELTNWPGALADFSNNTLTNYWSQLSTTMQIAQSAANNLDKANQALTKFRSSGTYAKLVRKYNALRKDVFGKLGDMQKKRRFDSGWAETFFRKESITERLTSSELDQRIAAMEATLTSLKTRRQALESTAQPKETPAGAKKKVPSAATRKTKVK